MVKDERGEELRFKDLRIKRELPSILFGFVLLRISVSSQISLLHS